MTTTPAEALTALNNMASAIKRGDEQSLMDEVQWLWRRAFPLSEIPKPNDVGDELALKACIVEQLSYTFALPPKNKLELPPVWALIAPASVKRQSVVGSEYEHFFLGDEASPIFAKRNIVAPRNYLFFV